MEAIVVFHDHGAPPFERFLKRGFRHCFLALRSGGYWIVFDSRGGRPHIEVVAAAAYDLAGFYRRHGFTVAVAKQRPGRSKWPLMAATCVGAVKGLLGFGAPWLITPYQLYNHLKKGA